MLKLDDFRVFWDGHASVRVEDNGFTVAVDPFKEVSPDFSADIVLVTHGDPGHFDPGKIEDICSGSTCVVVPEGIDEAEVPNRDVEVIEEGESIDVFGVEIEAIPMYNEHHQRGKGAGFRFMMGDTSFFAAGDTGLTDEMFELENRVDVAFLSVEGDRTMGASDAVKAAVRIKPDMVVPYHYGEPLLSDRNVDLRGLKAELEDRNIECKLMDPENV